MFQINNLAILTSLIITIFSTHLTTQAQPLGLQNHHHQAGCLPLDQTGYDFKSDNHATVNITSGGKERRFRIHVPANYQDTTHHALVLSFHGKNGSSIKQETLTQLSEKGLLINKKGIVAVYPEGSPSPDDGELAWQGAPYSDPDVDDIKFTSDILDDVTSKLCIDKNRIYVSGKSNGGGFSNLLACTPSINCRVAAFALVSGAYYPNTHPEDDCKPGKKVPVLISHGTDDGTVAFHGNHTGTDRAEPDIPTFATNWAIRNGHDGNRTTTDKKDLFRDPTPTEIKTWGSRDSNGETQFFIVNGLGHSWPTTEGLDKSGGDKAKASFNLTSPRLIDFFNTHSL